jgi:hypothetical protein
MKKMSRPFPQWDGGLLSKHRASDNVPMPSIAILREAEQLHNVSARLDSLAEQHALVSEALLTISRSVRNTATWLKVLVATKIAPLPD